MRDAAAHDHWCDRRCDVGAASPGGWWHVWQDMSPGGVCLLAKATNIPLQLSLRRQAVPPMGGQLWQEPPLISRPPSRWPTSLPRPRPHLQSEGLHEVARHWQQDVDMTEYQKQTFAGNHILPFSTVTKKKISVWVRFQERYRRCTRNSSYGRRKLLSGNPGLSQLCEGHHHHHGGSLRSAAKSHGAACGVPLMVRRCHRRLG